ncbi:hypothetical protein PG987_005116 [Apiospora arundinis]
MLPALAALEGVPVQYTVLDIEKEPDPQLLESEHVILGSNALHAAHDLKLTLRNLRQMLLPDEFLVVHETTAQML